MDVVSDDQLTRAWDRLRALGVEEQTLQIVTSINGYKMETMTDVLFAHTGYRAFDQLDPSYEEPERTNYGSVRKAGPFQGR